MALIKNHNSYLVAAAHISFTPHPLKLAVLATTEHLSLCRLLAWKISTVDLLDLLDLFTGNGRTSATTATS